jgi:hypothetical protein
MVLLGSLVVIDDFTRECLGLIADTSLRGSRGSGLTKGFSALLSPTAIAPSLR